MLPKSGTDTQNYFFNEPLMASISLEEMRLYLGKSLSSVNQNKINGRAPFSHNPFLARVSDAYRTTLVPFASCVQV